MSHSSAPQGRARLPLSIMNRNEDMNLMSLLAAVWRNKLLMLVSATVFVLMGGYYAFGVATPQYATGTTLALQLNTEPLIDIDKVIAGVSADEEAINTELQIIKSRNLLEQLVTEMDLLSDPEFNTTLRPEGGFSFGKLKSAIAGGLSFLFSDDTPTEEADPAKQQRRLMIDTVDTLRQGIETEHLRDTYIFRIRVTAGSPGKAARIANTLAELYIRDQLEQKFNATEQAVTWLAERVSELSTELEQKQNNAEAMRAQMDLVSSEALELASQRARSLRTRLEDASATRDRLIQQRDQLQQAGADADPQALAATLNDPVLTRLVPRLQSTDSDEATQARAAIETRLTALRNGLEDDIRRAEQQIDALRPSLERAEAEMNQQSDQLIQLQQMERDLASTQTLYETFLTRLKETTVQRGLQQADSRVLSAATPGDLVAPRRARIVVLAGILGLMFGGVIVALRQFSRTGVRTTQELEALTGLTVLGQVPKMPIRGRGDLLPYLIDKPASATAEAIRNLRTSLLLHDIDNPPQVIMSTSAIPGEGKTTQSISLSQNLVSLDKRVLLIEGDMRRLTFQQYFDLPQGIPGLVDTLVDNAPLSHAIQHHAGSGINVLTGGHTKANPADIYASERFRQLLNSLRQQYDYIVIDTPPVLVVPDALVVGQSVDAILMSVAWNATSRDQVVQALRQLDTVQLRPSGLVLSRVDPKGMGRYGYASYYSNYNNPYYEN